VDVLIISVALATALTITTIRSWRRVRQPLNFVKSRLPIGSLSIVTMLAWLWCYLLSAGPIIATLDWLDAPHDVRMVALRTVYRPLIWADGLLSFERWALLEWYFESWGI
jgi:hypothetical protein